MANSSEERDLDVFYFFFGEGPNRIERKMKRSQITAQRLASMFEVISVSLYVFGTVKIHSGFFSSLASLKGLSHHAGEVIFGDL